jgi:hypothetical protein
MPIIKVGKRSDLYWIYNKVDTYTVPDDTVGPVALPNEYDWGVANGQFTVTDRALGNWIPQEAIDNADTPMQPLVDGTEFLNRMLDLAQERRVVDQVFNTNNYSSSNVLTLTSSNQWDLSGGNAVENILGAIEACFEKANTVIMGADLWAVFRQLPQILDSVKNATRLQATPGGVATVEEMKGLFEINNWVVGRSRYNTAAPGAAPTYARLWPSNYCFVGYVNPHPGLKQVTWGVSFAETLRIAYRGFDGKRGIKGAHYLKVAWNQDNAVIANDVGFLFVNPISTSPTW